MDIEKKIKLINQALDQGRISQDKYEEFLSEILKDVKTEEATHKTTKPKVIEKPLSVREPDEAPHTEQEPKLAGVGVLIAIVVVSGILFYSSFSKPTVDELAEKAAMETQGFHCLSGWDGSHSDFVAQVKRGLRDPDSFEHIKTSVSAKKDGWHAIAMDYRAKNGFGGMMVGHAVGTYLNFNCGVTLIQAQ